MPRSKKWHKSASGAHRMGAVIPHPQRLPLGRFMGKLGAVAGVAVAGGGTAGGGTAGYAAIASGT